MADAAVVLPDPQWSERYFSVVRDPRFRLHGFTVAQLLILHRVCQSYLITPNDVKTILRDHFRATRPRALYIDSPEGEYRFAGHGPQQREQSCQMQ